MANIADLPSLPMRTGPARIREVFANDGADSYTVTEIDYVGDQGDFEWLALDSRYSEKNPDDSNEFILEYGVPRPIGGGYFLRTTTYGKVPATRYEYSSINYTFPGLDADFTGSMTVSQVGGYIIVTHDTSGAPVREPLTRTVLAQVRYDYVLLADLTASWIGSTADTVDDIPLVEPFRIIDDAGNTTDVARDADGQVGVATEPSASDYSGYIDDNRWLCAEASTVRRFMGRIYERRTVYVKAL